MYIERVFASQSGTIVILQAWVSMSAKVLVSVQIENITTAFQKSYVAQFAAPLAVQISMVFNHLAAMKNLVWVLCIRSWQAPAVQIVVWIAMVCGIIPAQQYPKGQQQQSHDLDSTTPWYNIGGPYCQIGKTVFEAITLAASKVFEQPAFLLTHIAKTHVPDICQKIRRLLLKDGFTDSNPWYAHYRCSDVRVFSPFRFCYCSMCAFPMSHMSAPCCMYAYMCLHLATF